MKWKSQNTDITRTKIIAESENGSTNKTVSVQWYKREVFFNVTDCSISYNVRVIEHNMCEESFTSIKKFVNNACSSVKTSLSNLFLVVPALYYTTRRGY